MKGSYAIAYSDKDGRDFCDSKPWILDDFSNKADCLAETMRLIKDGFKNVIPFKFSERRKATDEFDWDYVRNNKIDIK